MLKKWCCQVQKEYYKLRGVKLKVQSNARFKKAN